MQRQNIYPDAAWIKSTWTDVRKYLHQVFVQYKRSGQWSGDMGEWCSPEEQKRCLRAAFWKGGSSNTIVLHPTIIIYSIAILEQSDFEAIGWAMPSGAGMDNSVTKQWWLGRRIYPDLWHRTNQHASVEYIPWCCIRKYLHQVFVQYNRSSQQSGDMGEWCFPEEQKRCLRAAFWKGGSSNTIVWYPTVMI